ncbi:alpha/beta fold hydrolase [Sinomicrobium pectinilyticum]|uniref:Alpha/beta fold hydrolase n=1 Tax=Sinomicrobium pectinilyticum TaxID=1084421 RepID=A0A3N0E798_SINP1|nr:type I polyketide synthase [Sinomicrobium pectinilyticum]RNL83724.1 alpha/beta fold hydrolase [Sinomicrobium pectinilyticum]
MYDKAPTYSDRNDSSCQKGIAIVGMSCRFPRASTLSEFWELLKQGKNTVTSIPKERWEVADFYDPSPEAVNKTHQREASMLTDIHDFDPLFFRISPAEASEMHPSQKLMLELVWEAIENSNIPFDKVQGSRAGVYIGNIWNDFEHYCRQKNALVSSHSALGRAANIIANRISFVYGFTGPSLVVDTGCSASLVALHLACRSLWEGDTELAVAGGVNHLLDPGQYVLLSKFGGLSVQGQCSAFDKGADGFVRGEGGGVLLLKELSRAEADGDMIYAVIRNTAVNNNGHNANLPATSIPAQEQLLHKIYKECGIAPHEVHYVEAHGTGTKVGDPTEAKALGTFFSREREENKLYIGSVKTNIGHLEGAAGIAGVIKAVLSMQHKQLPASLHYRTPNPDIPFESLKLAVQHQLTSWPVLNGERLKAGVNSFGWGGTNAHVILEEYRESYAITKSPAPITRTGYCLPVSAKSTAALKDYTRAYAAILKNAPDTVVRDICVASAMLKPAFDHRVLFTTEHRDELLEALENFAQGTEEIIPLNLSSSINKLVMVFPGQGGQWIGMGKELLKKEPVFKEVIEACARAFRSYTDWNLVEVLQATPEINRLQEIDVIQPALCAIQIALARLWMSWGIYPDGVVGHSMGEVAAAHIAGILSLDDAARIICKRSALMKTVSGKGGAMMVTELSYKEASGWIEREYPELSVAVNNSPRSTVLAGDQKVMDKVKSVLEQRDIFCRQVKVDVASHSRQMDPLTGELKEALQDIKPQPGTIPVFSTCRNKIVDGEELHADYWVDNLRNTVQFTSAMTYLMNEGYTVFMEIGPHPVLSNAIKECAGDFKKQIITAASLYREEPELPSLYRNLGNLYEQGYTIDWTRFYGTTKAPDVVLPNYPFQREHFEIKDRSHLVTDTGKSPRFPLEGKAIPLADSEDTRYLERQISLEMLPFLKDFRINDAFVIPESVYIEMLLQVVGKENTTDVPVITGLHFLKSVILPLEGCITIQFKLDRQDKGFSFKFFVKADHIYDDGQWEPVAMGKIVFRSQAELHFTKTVELLRTDEIPEALSYYNALRTLGLDYQGSFLGLREIGKNDRFPEEVHFRIRPDKHILESADSYRVHPGLLDACFQPIYYTAIENTGIQPGRAAFLTAAEEITIAGIPDGAQELYGSIVFGILKNEEGGGTTISADIAIYDYTGNPVLKIKKLEGKLLGEQLAQDHYLGTFSHPEQGEEQDSEEFLSRFQSLSSREEKQEAAEQLLVKHVAGITKIPPGRIRPSVTFKDVGVDSLMTLLLRNDLEEELSLKLPVSAFWSHPSIAAYAALIVGIMDNREDKEHSLATGTNKVAVDITDWLVISRPRPESRYRLFCFHDAGGDSSLFRGWEHLLGTDIELVAVELPGRGTRLTENAYTDIHRLVTDIISELLPILDKPFLFFGHSMGGLLAFEIARELRNLHYNLPEKLILSGMPGPVNYFPREVMSTFNDTELTGIFPHLEKIRHQDKELFQLLIKRLRDDLLLLNRYRYVPKQKLPVPLITIHGKEDQRVNREQVEEWRFETSQPVKVISRPGGHRYLENDRLYLTAMIAEEVRALVPDKIVL